MNKLPVNVIQVFGVFLSVLLNRLFHACHTFFSFGILSLTVVLSLFFIQLRPEPLSSSSSSLSLHPSRHSSGGQQADTAQHSILPRQREVVCVCLSLRLWDREGRQDWLKYLCVVLVNPTVIVHKIPVMFDLVRTTFGPYEDNRVSNKWCWKCQIEKEKFSVMFSSYVGWGDRIDSLYSTEIITSMETAHNPWKRNMCDVFVLGMGN